MTGMGSTRDVQEFRIHPDRIKSLKTGECVVSVKSERFFDVVQIPPLNDENLPDLELPVHRAPLRADGATAPKAIISKVQDDYADILLAARGDKQ